MIKNWFGAAAHTTDEYIHWSSKDPAAAAKKLRFAYDIIKEAGFESELKVLLDAAYDAGGADMQDANNPDI